MIRLLLAALVALAVLAAPAAAARYEADSAVFANEDWDYEQAGVGDPCRSWVEADGSVRLRWHTKGAFRFSDAGANLQFGGISALAPGTLEVRRKIHYRVHQGGTQPPCVPCGPTSEYGPCGPPAAPDRTGDANCAPAPLRAGQRVLGTLSMGVLTVNVAGSAAKTLRDCPRGPDGTPLGMPDARPELQAFRGAGRVIRGLGPGRSHTFKREWKDGAGCGKRPKRLNGMRSCVKYRAVVVVRRLKDD